MAQGDRSASARRVESGAAASTSQVSVKAHHKGVHSSELLMLAVDAKVHL